MRRRATITQAAGNPAAPGTPLQLQAQVSGTSIGLTWIAGGGAAASNYVIEAGTSAGLANIGAFHTGSAAPAFGASNVPPGMYFVRVRAVNAAATSGPSNEVQFTVAGCLPAVPSGFQAAVSGARVDFSWQSVPGTSYLLQAGRAPGLADIGTLPLGSGSTASVTAPPGTYYVRLLAQNACGTSAPSSDVVVTVAAPQAPGPPGVVVYTVASGGVVLLSWSPPASGGAPTGYLLEAGSVTGASDLAQVPIGLQTTFAAPGVPPGVYHVRVRAVNGAGIGPASPDTVVTVP